MNDETRMQRLPVMTYSTRGLSQAEQAEAAIAYEDDFARIIPLDDAARGFELHDRFASFGDMIVGTRRVGRAHYIRSAREIRRNPIDHLCFILFRGGGGMIDEAIRPGSIFLHDHGQPLEARIDACDEVAVILPRDMMGRDAALVETLNGRSISGALAGLLADHMTSLANRMADLTMAEAGPAARATKAMIAASLAPTRDTLAEAREPIAQALIGRAKRHVESHLHDRALSADQLGRVLGVSRRQVFRLFEPFGGVERFIKRRRLARAHACLVDPGETRRIKEIGYDSGFPNAAEFSRCFREAFGYSPREAREAMTAERRLDLLLSRTPSGGRYGDLLRQMATPDRGH